ncbi:hypothetical protein EZS27_002095 [termite gut metagenome]|uniref:Uncharacterized protein n=1 Tax=termite gut metagenome TaxID=433724 RepID=A0A5J4SX73_9ZZZZ
MLKESKKDKQKILFISLINNLNQRHHSIQCLTQSIGRGFFKNLSVHCIVLKAAHQLGQSG